MFFFYLLLIFFIFHTDNIDSAFHTTVLDESEVVDEVPLVGV